MTNFAKVFCLVLVAAPLTHVYGLLIDQYEKKGNDIIEEIRSQYESVKPYVDAVVSQIELKPSPEWNVPFNPQSSMGKCFEFLSERIRTDRSRVAECSVDSAREAREQRELTYKTYQDTAIRIKSHKCMAMIKFGSCIPEDSNIIHSGCWSVFDSDMLKTVNETSMAFVEHVRKANNVLKNWIKKASHCAGISTKPSQEEEWRLASQDCQ